MKSTCGRGFFGACWLSLMLIAQASANSECQSDDDPQSKSGGALLQVRQSFGRVPLYLGSNGIGDDADLSPTGFQSVQDACCVTEMAKFIKKYIESTGRVVCHTGGLMGLAWWYDCEGDNDFDDLIKGERGVGPGSVHETGECPWIASTKEACSPMKKTCPKFPDVEVPDCTTSTPRITSSTSSSPTQTTPTIAPTEPPTQAPITTPTTTTTTPPDTCVKDYVNLDFTTAVLTENNLDGTGPKDDTSEQIRFSRVGRVGKGNGKPIDLVVSVKAGKTYEQNTVRDNNGFNCENLNGQHGTGHDTSCTTGAHFGQINVKADTSTTLVFSFQDKNSKPVTLSGFLFTIFDIDEARWVKEIYSISGWSKAVYDTTNSQATFTEEQNIEQGKILKAESKKLGDGNDNPTDPMELTAPQKKRSVMLAFKEKSEFELEIQAKCTNKRKCDKDGRNFLFAFKSKLVDDCK